nr:MAG TPA: hypothetical protein [Bacteriophage sp.]
MKPFFSISSFSIFKLSLGFCFSSYIKLYNVAYKYFLTLETLC